MRSNQMGEIQCQDDPTLPAKRKLHPPTCQEPDLAENEKVPSKKSIKIQSLSPKDARTLQPAPSPDKGKGLAGLEGEEEDDDGDYQEDDEEQGVAVDRKGKGVLVVEDLEGDDDSSHEEDDEDLEGDDDSSHDEDGSELEGEDDDSEADEEDPLAEIDLDNILPSRTRRGSSRGGVSIRGGDRDSDS